MLEVGEDPIRLEQVERFGVEGALAVVLEMVDREGGDDGVKRPRSGSGAPRSCSTSTASPSSRCGKSSASAR